MQEFTPEQLQERFTQLAPEMREAISSPKIHDAIKEIGRRNGLMIDQIGDLVDQVGLVMLGLAKASDFVRDTASRLAINDQKAQAIATDINRDVFESLKQILRKNEEATTRSSSISSLERAGGFEIEKDIPGNGEKGVERANATAAAMTETDKINMLSDIENPKPVKETLSEEILHAPPMNKPPETKNQPPANLPTSDPYREPMK